MKGGEFVGRIKFLLAVGIPLFILAYVNLAIYPFTTSHPNYSDVERVFSRFQFPTNWLKTQEFEEKGYGGRRCSFDLGPGCYYKSAHFALPANATLEDAKEILIKAGCSGVQVESSKYKGEEGTNFYLRCTIDGLGVGSGFDDKQNHFNVSVNT